MSKYDKTVSIEREEEASYHRREYDCEPSHSKPATTTTTTTTERYALPAGPSSSSSPSGRRFKSLAAARYEAPDEENNFDEWTVSKLKVNHKTRQVETRVSRQLLVEDGKVIADSGPQVTTRIKEDNKVEECEKERAPKGGKGRFEALDGAQECGDQSTGRVLGEKKEIQRTSREVREENMQYHDERFKELTGQDVHRRAIKAPHELITITDDKHRLSHDSAPRGKMVHYSNKGKKYQDTDEIFEVAKLAIDGSITKEVKRTKHHEEFSEDELPDEKGEAEALRREPIATRSSRRHVDYVNDFDDLSTPSGSENDEREHYDSRRAKALHHHKFADKSSRRPGHHHQDEAFPRYEIDPLLNSLRDEDFRPASGRGREISLERKQSSDSDERPASRTQRTGGAGHRSPQRHFRPEPAVEIPEEYRVNKQRLMSSKATDGSRQLAHRGHKQQHAAVQAHLTDEEAERKSLSSSSSIHSHEKTTRKLERQSTRNSSRNYYFGEPRKGARQRALSVSSSASTSSLERRTKTRAQSRQRGTQSRDSGFRSPHSQRTETPLSSGSGKGQQQIYSVSSKSRGARTGASSPTPTSGSLGQRSVKTTTTTMSAGLADRGPAQRDNERAASNRSPSGDRSKGKGKLKTDANKRRRQVAGPDVEQQFDTVSLSSLGPNATTIKVPYRRVADIEAINSDSEGGGHSSNERSKRSRQWQRDNKLTDGRDSAGEMSLQEDIKSLSRRLAEIKRDKDERRHFDYKTIVAQVQGAPEVPRQRQVLDTYNVQVVQHNSPFYSQPIKSMTELSENLAQLEQISAEQQQQLQTTTTTGSQLDNNNEANFNLNDYVKYRAVPVLVETPTSMLNDDDDDRASMAFSSCSLHSSKTYNIRWVDRGPAHEEAAVRPGQVKAEKEEVEVQQVVPFDENGDGKSPAAWIFDPRDGSSTAIVAPPKPRGPEAPKVATEELVQSRGGRSYYLELVEASRPGASSQGPSNRRTERPSSVDSLYARWSSSGVLDGAGSGEQQVDKQQLGQHHNSQRQLAGSRAPLVAASSRTNLRDLKRPPMTRPPNGQGQARRQLPFGGPPLANRSKSSSCLLSVTKPSRYSIYGGFRRPDESKKPVPRLSYSRAIGPKSQRQLDAQSKTPSRYLKMK